MKYTDLHRSLATYKIFFIAALMSSSVVAIGQTNVAVAPIKMNVLYIDVDNPVSVAASGATDDKVTVSITGGGGIVSKVDVGIYNVRVTSVTDDCTLNVYVDGKLAGSSPFRVRSLPQPIGLIGIIHSGATITADYLRSQAGLTVGVMNSPFETRYEVLGFTVNLPHDKGVKSVDCQGSRFSSEARQYINQSLKSGDVVTIENIRVRVKGAGGNEVKLASLMYYIK